MINLSEKVIIKVMKLLLIRPFFSVEEFYFPRFIHEPLGLEYLASYLSRYHEIKLMDALTEDWNKYWKLDEYPETIFQGAKPNQLLEAISEFNPDIIGLNWLFSTQNNSIELAIQTIKKLKKNIPIIVGGPHPSGNPEEILKQNKDINIVVYGEGEVTLKEILDNKAENLNNIKGVAFRQNGRIIKNAPRELIQNLDDLPFPQRDPQKHKNYSKQYFYESVYLKLKNLGIKNDTNIKLTSKITSVPYLEKVYYAMHNIDNRKKLPSADIITSRGCPNHCSFCAIHNIWGHAWRMRSAENVLEEIEYLVNNFKIKHLNLHDENFNVLKERTIKICKGIVKNKYNLTLLSSSGAFVPTLDEEVLTWLKRAGLNNLRMSIESGDQNILYNVIKKNIDLTKVKQIVDICKKLGIQTEGAFIFGIPGETIETMRRSLEFATETGFDRVIKFVFQPFPNTELYDICIKNNYLTRDYDPKRLYITGNKCYIKTDKFTPEDVLRIVNR